MMKETKNKMPQWIGNQTIICEGCGSHNRLGTIRCDYCGQLLIKLNDQDFWRGKEPIKYNNV